jgi:thiamine biosynthesis lipoprotein
MDRKDFSINHRDIGKTSSGFNRRRFLAGLGILVGAGALTPVFSGMGRSRVESVEASRPMLGTWVRIVAKHQVPERAGRAIESAYAAIARVDGQMSIHRADSQLARLNQAAGRDTVPVDDALLDVLETACDAARRSRGAFDPTILPLMRLYGFYESGRSQYPSDREIAATLEAVGWEGITIDRSAGTAGLERSGAAIDLGSIGKGWALDRAVDALRAEGIGSALVDVGGNVYGLGAPEEGAEGWSVASVHPQSGRVERLFVLRDCAVATSGNYERNRKLGAVSVGHLLDARRGRPAQDLLSVSVQASSGVAADVLSTSAYLLGADRFRGWPEALQTHFIG